MNLENIIPFQVMLNYKGFKIIFKIMLKDIIHLNIIIRIKYQFLIIHHLINNFIIKSKNIKEILIMQKMLCKFFKILKEIIITNNNNIIQNLFNNHINNNFLNIIQINKIIPIHINNNNIKQIIIKEKGHSKKCLFIHLKNNIIKEEILLENYLKNHLIIIIIIINNNKNIIMHNLNICHIKIDHLFLKTHIHHYLIKLSILCLLNHKF